MPDVILHFTMGLMALNRLDGCIANFVNTDEFRFGLLGPVPHIYYRFFAPHFHHGINRRSYLMHNIKTGDFLIELAKRATTDKEFSYLAGFLGSPENIGDDPLRSQ